MVSISTKIKSGLGNFATKSIVTPLTGVAEENVTDITTSIGRFVIRSVMGKISKSISFTIGASYNDSWMEEALYGILNRYNKLEKESNLELTNYREYDGSGMYHRLSAGPHTLKYRGKPILVIVEDTKTPTVSGRVAHQRVYRVITYEMNDSFVTNFEKDMLLHRNSILKIRADSAHINVYNDSHDNDGYTYWDKISPIHKRSWDTIYLPYETKKQIVDTVNHFFASKEFDKKHGIPHNLKILLYGCPGGGKDSIAKAIASEWCRNIYYVTGGKNGRFVPNALTSHTVNSPLFLVSDIDKYPFLITDTPVDVNTESQKDEKMLYKQSFGQMLQALDGAVAGEDRIIVMTTNYIEKFDPALTRAGRIDLKIEIKPLIFETFRKFVYDFYKDKDGKGVIVPKKLKLKNDNIVVADLHADVRIYKLTAAEIIEKHCK